MSWGSNNPGSNQSLHEHNCIRTDWSGPQQQTQIGTDENGNPIYQKWHVAYWREACACGHVCNSGESTFYDPS